MSKFKVDVFTISDPIMSEDHQEVYRLLNMQVKMNIETIQDLIVIQEDEQIRYSTELGCTIAEEFLKIKWNQISDTSEAEAPTTK